MPIAPSCPAPSSAAPRIADLLALDDAGFRAVFAGSPIKRIGRNRMVRNAAIAAGNSGDPAFIPALQNRHKMMTRWRRRAATWALGRLTTTA